MKHQIRYLDVQTGTYKYREATMAEKDKMLKQIYDEAQFHLEMAGQLMREWRRLDNE